MRIFYPALSLLSVLLFSCDGDDKRTLHLNIVGAAHQSFAPSPSFKASWTDATLNPLGDESSHLCGAANGQDIYYGGAHNGSPSYWKNGDITKLDGSGYVQKMFVLNGDVYCAGFVDTEFGQYTPVYWKNKDVTILNTDANVFTSIFVSGGDVYLTGNSNFGIGLFLKNGDQMTISDYRIYLTGVAVAGNSTHVIGNKGSDAFYIKNYVNTPLQHSIGATVVIANSVFVDSTDVYVAGQQFNGTSYLATYWKNGTPVILKEGNNALRIKRSGDDLYILGYKEEGDQMIPTYWKNEIETKVQLSTTPSISEYEVFDFDFFTK